MFSGTSTAISNYGASFTKGGSAPARAMVIDFPEVTTEPIEITNHANGGKSEFMPSGLITVGDVTVSLLLPSGTLSVLYAEMENKTVSACVIRNATDIMTFQGFYNSIKPEPADATSPDAQKVTLVITPTGVITYT